MEGDQLTPAGSTASSQDLLVEELQKTKELLVLERRRSMGLAEELRRLKEQNLAVQKQVEQEEEFITNTLMKRLKQAKDEKQKLANEVEHEEEYLVNNLQKRLQQVAAEKVDLETQLEIEQEYIVNKLEKSLEELKEQSKRLSQEKVDLENQLEAEQEYIVNKLQKQVDHLAKEKAGLQEERANLRRHVADLAASAEQLTQEKIRFEAEKEMEEESIVNRLQRQIEALINNYKDLESSLERKGVNLKDLAPLTIDSTTEWTYGRSPTHRPSIDLSRSSGSRRSSGMWTRPSISSPSNSMFLPSLHSAPPSAALRSPSADHIDRNHFRQQLHTHAQPSPPEKLKH